MDLDLGLWVIYMILKTNDIKNDRNEVPKMEWIKSILNMSSERGKFDSGVAMYKMGGVTEAYAKEKETEVLFYGNVHDEYRRQTYSCMLSVDKVGRRMLESSCDCHQVVSNHPGPEICAHVVAAAYKGIEVLNEKKNELLEQQAVVTPEISVSLSAVKKGCFNMEFQIEGIPKSKYRKIFTSYKKNNRLFYIGDGHYLNLEEPKLKQILSMIDILGVYNEIEKIKIPEQKALFLAHQLEIMPFVEGKEHVREGIQKLARTNVNETVPLTLKKTLREYQREGFDFLVTLARYGLGGILADEMGLGKTLQVITFLLAQKGAKSLIITPTALIYNWKKEIERFAPSLKVGIVHGVRENRYKVLEEKENYDIILTTYTTYKNDEAYYKDTIFDYCIIDEAQHIKNPKSQITQTIKGVKSKVRFALTGTPMENNLLELWSLMDFVMPGYLYNPLRFQNIFMTQPPQTEELRRLISPFILRRTKEEVLAELPDKIEQNVVITLESYHQKTYWAMKKLIKQKIQADHTNRAALLAYLTKLRQICLVPERMVKQYKGENSKLEYLMGLLKEIPEQKVLIFSQFTTVLGEIGKRLQEENICYSYLDGQTSAKERMELVDAFNEMPEQKIFLISLKAGGTGLNLTGANTVVHFDPWWNPAVEDQASARAHRMGQKQVVNVIKLVAKETIEEHIISLQESKKGLIAEVMNGQAQNLLGGLSEDELMQLLI